MNDSARVALHNIEEMARSDEEEDEEESKDDSSFESNSISDGKNGIAYKEKKHV